MADMITPAQELCEVTVKFLQNSGYRVIYCALYGAQNYNLQRPTSDFDYKAVVVPTLEDIVFNKKPISETVTLPFDGQVDVKDVRLMIDQWKKGAANFMELLFSDWFWIHPDYPIMQWFRDNREQIAHANEESALRAMIGMVKEKFRALQHPYPIQKEEVEKYGYAAKQLHHELRVLDMIRHFKQLSYSELLNPFKGEDKSRQNHFDYIRQIKNRDINLTEEEAVSMGAEIQKEADAWLDIYKEKSVLNLNFDADTIAAMDYWKFLIIKKALQDELLRG